MTEGQAPPALDSTRRIAETIRVIVVTGILYGVVVAGIGSRLAMLLLRVTSSDRVIALSALVIVSSLASPEFGWRGAIVNTVVLVIFCVGVFVYGINLQFPVWPTLFR